MNVKRKNTANRVLTYAERKRLADFFMLLAHIDRRMTREAKKARPRAQKEQLCTKQKTRLNYEDRKARTYYCRPCFLSSFLYLKISKRRACIMIDTIVLLLTTDMFHISKPDLTIRLEQLQEADESYYMAAKYILKLANKAYDIFIGSEVEEKDI